VKFKETGILRNVSDGKKQIGMENLNEILGLVSDEYL
jgi:hypothetical protein